MPEFEFAQSRRVPTLAVIGGEGQAEHQRAKWSEVAHRQRRVDLELAPAILERHTRKLGQIGATRRLRIDPRLLIRMTITIGPTPACGTSTV